MNPSSSPPRFSRPQPRKRRHQQLDDIGFLSSDPPVFSSDPPEPGLDTEHRSKRLYKGTWWGDKHALAPNKSEFERNFDSGVFMASDDSLRTFDSIPGTFGHPSRSVAPGIVTTTSPSLAHVLVNRAIEKGDEVVDLS
jgi:hypothetical protein